MYTYIFSNNQGIGHKIEEWRLGEDIVEGIGGFEQLVSLVMHDWWRQRVKTHHIRYITVVLKLNATRFRMKIGGQHIYKIRRGKKKNVNLHLYNKAIYDVGPWNEPMSKFLLG